MTIKDFKKVKELVNAVSELDAFLADFPDSKPSENNKLIMYRTSPPIQTTQLVVDDSKVCDAILKILNDKRKELMKQLEMF